MMTQYKIHYALFDQAYDAGGGFYWTWHAENLPRDMLLRFYENIREDIPQEVNKFTPDTPPHGSHTEFEDYIVVYRFYNGNRDRVGRPNRYIILTAWLKKIEEDESEFTNENCQEIFNLPKFTKLSDLKFAQRIPIPEPWNLCEMFPSEEDILRKEKDILQKEYDSQIQLNKHFELKNKQLLQHKERIEFGNKQLKQALIQAKEQQQSKLQPTEQGVVNLQKTGTQQFPGKTNRNVPPNHLLTVKFIGSYPLKSSFQYQLQIRINNDEVIMTSNTTADDKFETAQFNTTTLARKLIELLKKDNNEFQIDIVQIDPIHRIEVLEYQKTWWSLGLYSRKVKKTHEIRPVFTYDKAEINITDTMIELTNNVPPQWSSR